LTPGYYTIKVDAVPSNGYGEKKVTKDVIVRDDNYGFTVGNEMTTYNGRTQGVTVAITGMDIEAALAQKSWTVTYRDAAGNMVEPNQAGTYTYTVTLPASAYWTEKTATGTFTIAKREVSVVDVVAQAKVYDGATGVNLQEIVLEDAATDQGNNGTGLPTGNTGIINGDGIYAIGAGATDSANAGKRTLTVSGVTLLGDDADNYVWDGDAYSESFTIQRNQVQGDIADSTYLYGTKAVPADDIYLIDQQGSEITNYTITYYYHNGEGVEKVDGLSHKGMYTVIARPDQANYKGGASQAIYVVSDNAKDAEPSKDFSSATIAITNTVELYGAEGNQGIQATATNGTVKVEYYVNNTWTETAPTDAGRYLVKVTATTTHHTDTAYGLYTIVKARPVLTLTAADAIYDSALYDGNPQLTNSSDNSAAVYYTFSGDTVIGEHASGVNVDYQAPADAGTYTVTAHVGETANYTAHEVSATFTIEKADLTITADNLQRQQYGAYPEMVATYEGLATDGVAPDASLRDVQIQPEFATDWVNFAQDHVGSYDITPSSALAKNYNIAYVAGKYAVTAEDPKPTLAIHGLPDNGTDVENIVYYGDTIQLYAYGNQVDDVISDSSLLTWKVSDSTIAAIDENGLLTIKGVGDFTITLTRGIGMEAIETSVTVEAKKKEVKVEVPSLDRVYIGSEYNYASNRVYAVDEMGKEVTATFTVDNRAHTDVGGYVVTGKAAEADTLYQSETYGGLFTINDREVTIDPNAVTTTYGTSTKDVKKLWSAEGKVTGGADVLSNGLAVSLTDAYDNLDVGEYEILVAGRENINYNVSYKKYEANTSGDANAVTVEKKALTIETGSYDGEIGITGGSVNPEGDYPAQGEDFDTSAMLEGANVRMYGEPNWVMGYVIETLIDGDSEADLDKLLAWLEEFSKDVHHGIDEDANIEYSESGPTDEYIDGKSDYEIDSEMAFGNYNVTVTKGTQNIYQRPVTLSLDSTISAYYGDVVENGNVDTDALKAFLEAYITVGEYNGIGGLAELLNHTAKDLDLQISKASYDDADDEITATISIGNQNYWMEEGSIEITIPVVKDAYTVRYDAFNATNATVTILHLDEDGNSTPANLPTDCKLYCVIYVRDDSLKTYADYAAYGEVAYRGEMTRSGSTGRYTISYPRLTGSFKMFAIAEGPGITLVQIDNP
jgi:hypothetical protein